MVRKMVELWVSMEGDDVNVLRMVLALRKAKCKKTADRIERECLVEAQAKGRTNMVTKNAEKVLPNETNIEAKKEPTQPLKLTLGKPQPPGQTCYCGDEVKVRLGRWRNRENWGRKYYECEKKPKRCKFFLWAEPPLTTDQNTDIEVFTTASTVTDVTDGQPEEHAITPPPSPPVANVSPNNAADLSPSPPPEERQARPRHLSTEAVARSTSAPPISRTPSGGLSPEVKVLLEDIMVEEIPKTHRTGRPSFVSPYNI